MDVIANIGNTTTDTVFSINVVDAKNNVVKVGNVTVKNGNTVLGTVDLSKGNTFSTIFSPAGSYTLSFTYNDTSNVYTNNSVTKDLVIPTTGTTIKVIAIPGTIKTNTVFNINVTDPKNNVVKVGNVTVKNANTVLGTVDLSKGNTFSTILSSTGSYTLSFTYNDTSNVYTNNTNTTTFTVGTSSSSIIVKDVTGTTNQEITITALVTSKGKNIDNGNVTFTDGNGLDATVDVNNGIATITTKYSKMGTYLITATYNGNNMYNSNQTTATATIRVSNVNMNMTVTPSTTTGNTTFNITLKDTNGNNVTDGIIYFYNNGTIIGNTTVTNGTATFNYTFNKAGNYNITAVYENNTIYNTTNKTVQFTIQKSNTTIVVNPIIGTVQNTITLQVNITDQYGNNVTGGVVVFKINGNTIKDNNGNVIYVNVTNGIATLPYTITNSLTKDNLIIQAVYSGTDNTYNSSRNNNTINVTKRTANINLIVTKDPVKATDIVTFMTIVRDTNGTILNNGVVVFKFQGKTIRDNKGNPILVNVTNGQATLEYTIPNGISAKTYNITAVYANKDYNKAETTAPLTTEKIQTRITLNTTTTIRGSNTTLLTGIIKDINGNLMVGTHKIAVKLNGKSIGTYTTTNGIINSNITIPNTLKNTNYNITVKIGESNGYYQTNSTTTLKINNVKTYKQKVSI